MDLPHSRDLNTLQCCAIRVLHCQRCYLSDEFKQSPIPPLSIILNKPCPTIMFKEGGDVLPINYWTIVSKVIEKMVSSLHCWFWELVVQNLVIDCVHIKYLTCC